MQTDSGSGLRQTTEDPESPPASCKGEPMLARAQRIANLASWEWDIAAGELSWSDQHFRMFGFQPGEFRPTYESFLALVHPEDRTHLETAVGKALAGGSYQTEFRAILADSSVHHFYTQADTDFDAAGTPVRMVGTVLDVTEHKRLEEELRQRAEELQKLMDIAPAGLLVAHDPQCRDITGNRAGNAMFEGEEGANLSLTPQGNSYPSWRFFRDGVAILPEELPLQVAAAGGIEVRDWEAEALMPSGARKFIWGNAIPLRDAAGQVRGAVAAYEDITATRQRSQALLRESEERFRNTADTAPVIMWYGDAQKRTTFFNKQTTVFTGLPAEQLLGDGWGQVIHPDDLEMLRRTYQESSDESVGYQVEYRVRRADGEYRQMLGTTSPRYVGDVYAGQVGTVLDITDLKRRQEENLARAKLESLGTLARGIAHDFNNLLGGILSQAELASIELAAGTSPEAELNRIRSVVIRGAEIVRQLMVYAGQDVESSELVDVSRLVDETTVLLEVVASKRATLRYNLGADVPAVRANPATLRQVLINLVTNASQAIGEQGGVIQVTTARVTVNLQKSAPAAGPAAGDYLRLEVSDTGSGMTPETQARIFDPFFTTKSSGHGLGLPAVQGIVSRLGGQISVWSEPGQGATFQILLPGAGEPPAHSPELVAAIGDIRGAGHGTVLVVEDEDGLRLAVSRVLHKAGFTVLEAAGGSEAIEMLRTPADDFSAMLLDVTLPGIPSSEVLREAKRVRPDLLVILTSAHAEQTVAEMVTGSGSLPFLRKPYRMADLLKLLR
jgi:PAS domain S-box-containing protein